jgi:hypothetical protein
MSGTLDRLPQSPTPSHAVHTKTITHHHPTDLDLPSDVARYSDRSPSPRSFAVFLAYPAVRYTQPARTLYESGGFGP